MIALGVVLAAALGAGDGRGLVEVIKPSLALVITEEGTGTAFFLGVDEQQNGWFLTNRHVVAGIVGPDEVQLLDEPRAGLVRRTAVERVYADERADLALLQISDQRWVGTSGVMFRPDPVEQDEALFCVGFPNAYSDRTRFIPEPTLTRGAVVREDQGFIESTTRANPGNSGGPALSADGRVLGVLTAKRLDSGHSLVTPVSAVRSFATRVGLRLNFLGGRPTTRKLAGTTAAPIPGAVQVTVGSSTVQGVLFQPRSGLRLTYLAFAARGLHHPVGARYELTVSSGSRRWSGVGQLAAIDEPGAGLLVELPRLEGWAGASLGDFDEVRTGRELDAQLALQVGAHFEMLGSRRLMVSRVEQSALVRDRVARFARLDFTIPSGALAQGLSALRGRVVGLVPGTEFATDTVEVVEVNLYRSILRAQLAGELRVVEQQGQCTVKLAGRLTDPQGEATSIELRLGEQGSSTGDLDAPFELPGRATSVPPAPSLELSSASVPCASMSLREVQLVIRGKEPSHSPVLIVPRAGWSGLVPSGATWARGPLPVGTAQPRTRRELEVIALAGSSLIGIDPRGKKSVVHLEKATPIALTPDGLLAYRGGSFVLGEMVLTPACTRGTPVPIPSRWPRLAWRCEDEVLINNSLMHSTGAQLLAIDGQGATLLRLPWGGLGIGHDSKLEELSLLPARVDQLKFVRSLEKGFLAAFAGDAIDVLELQVGEVRDRTHAAGRWPTRGVTLADDGRLAVWRDETPLAIGAPTQDGGAELTELVPDVASGPVSPRPARLALEDSHPLIAMLTRADSNCNPSQPIRPGDAHFYRRDEGVLYGLSSDLTVFRSHLPGLRYSIDAQGHLLTVSGSWGAPQLIRKAGPELFRLNAQGACVPIGALPDEPVELVLPSDTSHVVPTPDGPWLTVRAGGNWWRGSQLAPQRLIAVGPSGLYLQDVPCALVQAGVGSVPLPLEKCAAARWVGDRFLVLEVQQSYPSKGPWSPIWRLALWHVSPTMLVKVGDFPDLEDVGALVALSLDDRGGAHVELAVDSNSKLLSAGVTDKQWTLRGRFRGAQFMTTMEPAL